MGIPHRRDLVPIADRDVRVPRPGIAQPLRLTPCRSAVKRGKVVNSLTRRPSGPDRGVDEPGTPSGDQGKTPSDVRASIDAPIELSDPGRLRPAPSPVYRADAGHIPRAFVTVEDRDHPAGCGRDGIPTA